MFAHEMQPGDAYQGLTFTVTAEMNQQFLFALGSFHPRYIEHGNHPPLVHPVILLHYTPRTRSPSFRLAPGMGSVFARDHTEFLQPARIGDLLSVTWHVDAVYERNGRTVQDYTAKLFKAGDTLVLNRTMSSAFMVGSAP